MEMEKIIHNDGSALWSVYCTLLKRLQTRNASILNLIAILLQIYELDRLTLNHFDMI